MLIAQLWMSQRQLRRAGQIPDLVSAVRNGDELPKITIVHCNDGECQLHDGHHRLAAYWLASRTRLERHEYVLLEQDDYRRTRCGRIANLIGRCYGPPPVSSDGRRPASCRSPAVRRDG